MQKITTFLTFADQAEEAINFYMTLFPGATIDNISRWKGEGHCPPGTAMVINFTIAGQKFMALNSGSDFGFSNAISLYVKCDDQAEIDRIWNAILENGGKEMACGWIGDKWGVAWQIIPAQLDDLVGSDDAEANSRTLQALWGMVKLDLAALQAAHRGE